MLLLLLVMFGINSCVVYCESCTQKNVSRSEGGEVVLRVHQTGIRTINWILLPEGNVIVTTKPGRSIEDDDVRKQYRGRVRSEADGSLHINHLSPQDQRSYKADIQTKEDQTFCILFNLTVYERLSDGDIKINHSLTRNGSCSLRLLCSVNKRDVNITWSNLNGSDVNATQGVLYVPPGDVNFTYICNASNPVSNVSKTVSPKEYCDKDNSQASPKLNLPWILGILFTICVIILIFVIYKRMGKGKGKKEDISTTYAQVEKPQGPDGNLYHEPQKDQQCLTVYSEVQYAKENRQNGTNAQSAGPSNPNKVAAKD
ncbi:SLAM family member 9-like isoform 2-T2 [Anomaloglossus baeobatrachus]|uniref:SLAM family member 9-like isoform X2 n=1 Tax=Anomaloglossus baeobatrachus TaxID=238106 RepID=UPI003F4F7DB4